MVEEDWDGYKSNQVVGDFQLPEHQAPCLAKYTIKQVLQSCEEDIEKTDIWLKTKTFTTQSHEVTELNEDNVKLEVDPDTEKNSFIKDGVDDCEESEKYDGHDFEDSPTVTEELNSTNHQRECRDEV